MITGTIILEDHRLIFDVNYDTNTVSYMITNIITNKSKTKKVPQDKFFKALAIAVHNDGMPDYEKDYPDAEEVQPDEKELRWIP